MCVHTCSNAVREDVEWDGVPLKGGCVVSLCIRHRATTAHMLATPPEVLSDSVTLMFINASEGSENANICDSSDCSVSDTRQSSPSSPGGGGAGCMQVSTGCGAPMCDLEPYLRTNMSYVGA